MQERLMKLLNIRPGEGQNVTLMMVHYFFMGAAMILASSASLALFFEAWDITALPYVYLGLALIVSSITSLFLKISERTSLARFLVLCLSFILTGTILFRVGLAFTTSKWLMLVLPVWASTLLFLSVTAFWTLAGNIFDIRQAKRIFGLMNAGSWLAYVIVGPFVTLLVHQYGTKNLYTVVALCVAAAFATLFYILRINPHISRPVQSLSDPAAKPITLRNLIRKPYILLIFLMIALWHIAFFMIDNIFYDRATLQYPATDLLAGFLGIFFAFAGLLGLITDVFLTGRILSRFGLRAGLLTTPTLTIICATLIAVTGTLNASAMALLFWLAATGRFINEGLGFSLDQSTFALLNQPLEATERARVQTSTEGIVRPLAAGLAAGLLLLLNTHLKFKATQLTYVYLLIAAAWVTVGIFLIRAYQGALKEALHKRRFGESGIDITELANAQILENALNSPHRSDVIYALELLEQTQRETILETSIRMLNSVHAQVRLNVVQRIERLHLVEALPALKSQLKSENDPTVLHAAASALTFMRRRYAILLDSSDPFVQRGAWLGLLRSNHAQTFPDAKQRLEALAVSPLALKRKEAVALIAESSNPALSDILLPLIADADLFVRNEAIRAAGKMRHASLWVAIIQALNFHPTRRAAFSALVAGGEAALDEIKSHVMDQTLDLQARIRLVRACAKIKSPTAIHELKQLLEYPNTHLRSRVLIALHTSKYIAEKEFIPYLEARIQNELKRAAWLLACLRDVQSNEETELLVRALRSDLLETRNRLFYLFSFIYDPLSVRWALHALAREDASRRAYAIEMIDAVLSTAHKLAFVPLLENFSESQRLKHMAAFYPQEVLSNDERLMQIVHNPYALEFPWLIVTALQTALQLNLSGSRAALATLLTSNETSLVRHVKRMHQEETMLSTIERVMILKSISLFASTPDEALAELADLLEEIEVCAGDTVVEQGTEGDSMYVIVRGRVAVMDRGRVLNELGTRAIFGELSLLDSEPRSATIRALEDGTLLRLTQTAYYDLMSDYVEVAMGTIQMLTRNLRARTKDVVDLNRILQQ